MKIEEIEPSMSEITDVLTSTSGKLDHAAHLNLLLGRKLDRFADNTSEALSRLAGNIDRQSEKTHEDFARLAQQISKMAEHVSEGFDRLTDQSLRTDQTIDRLADKIDRLVDALASRNGN
jgi:methyl-accepting chemotaxis protein